MERAIAYEIIDHGIDHSQYFQGCGTAFTNYDVAVTGIGDSAKAAYEDAVDHCYQMEVDPVSLDKLLPKRPRGIRLSDRVPAALLRNGCNEVYWHISIRLKLA